jgi:hypothetical protein
MDNHNISSTVQALTHGISYQSAQWILSTPLKYRLQGVYCLSGRIFFR